MLDTFRAEKVFYRDVGPAILDIEESVKSNKLLMSILEFRHNKNKGGSYSMVYHFSHNLPYVIALHSRRRLTTPATATTVDVWAPRLCRYIC